MAAPGTFILTLPARTEAVRLDAQTFTAALPAQTFEVKP